MRRFPLCFGIGCRLVLTALIKICVRLAQSVSRSMSTDIGTEAHRRLSTRSQSLGNLTASSSMALPALEMERTRIGTGASFLSTGCNSLPTPTVVSREGWNTRRTCLESESTSQTPMTLIACQTSGFSNFRTLHPTRVLPQCLEHCSSPADAVTVSQLEKEALMMTLELGSQTPLLDSKLFSWLLGALVFYGSVSPASVLYTTNID